MEKTYSKPSYAKINNSEPRKRLSSGSGTAGGTLDIKVPKKEIKIEK